MRRARARPSSAPRWLKGNRNALASFRYLAFHPLFFPAPLSFAFLPLRARFPLNVIFRTSDRPDFAFVSCFALRLLPRVLLRFTYQALKTRMTILRQDPSRFIISVRTCEGQMRVSARFAEINFELENAAIAAVSQSERAKSVSELYAAGSYG